MSHDYVPVEPLLNKEQNKRRDKKECLILRRDARRRRCRGRRLTELLLRHPPRRLLLLCAIESPRALRLRLHVGRWLEELVAKVEKPIDQSQTAFIR